MMQNKTIYWLWLRMIFGTDNIRLLGMLGSENNVRELYYALHDPDCGLLSDKERQRLKATSLEQAQNVLAHCEKNGIGIMTWEDALYPDRLRNIYNPPTVLFYRGDPTLLHRGMLLTCVGTRRPSDYSLRVATWLCTDLARCGVVIVSGCAMGLDSASHLAALEAGAPTIGVLGCGVDYDYPRDNRALRERIVQNGLLLSEYFPGVGSNAGHFPVRNRILAGISEAVLILEASHRSGSLITANCACEQGKSVFCVPPADVFDNRYSGVNNFLRDGAYPVFNYLDVLYAFYLKYPHKLKLYDDEDACRTQDSLLFRDETPKRRSAARRKKAEAPAEPVKVRLDIIPEEASEDERRVLEFLREGVQTSNEICCRLGLSFDEVSMLLLEMELNGWIVNTQRDLFSLPERGE